MLNDSCDRRDRRKTISGVLLTAGLAGGILGVTNPALADPVVTPPPLTKLPPVFCFRFTDVQPVEDDPEGDKFNISFEVLNWSNQPASGVRIALNTGTNSFVSDEAAFFAGAEIDGNGRPIGTDADPLPGNQPFANTGSVVQSSQTAIEWEAEQHSFNTGTSGAIPNSDLLGVGERNTPGACALVPGCELTGSANPFFATPIVPNWETVDNGNNVLDGFVLTVDDFDEGEALSFNWNLLDAQGEAIGIPGSGNEYGFGTVNIARFPLQGSDDTFQIFPENTGVSTSNRIFADNANEVRNSQGQVVALLGAEFGAGIAAPLLNPEDNILSSPANTQPILHDPDDEYEPPTDVPEPSSLAMLGLAAVSLWRHKRKRQRVEVVSLNP
ncbi:PEP-CTERM sorting domain-containing protein [Roseofilum casamattae]|uniref:PEP-CTERM sorting domain-containing protein n=1 Tax=Roseofilum casamattae BLCC-M143 TaxID=3022442 RepID=A0ABT7C446_9CYAN|nr:PEP-CTERM sorting domain-containing protein [Roseofilum casamattae]MDJ1185659.1 PEP-CTERM sorting domain-containing protein [Roseofilum casamattae BLCC-M143]